MFHVKTSSKLRRNCRLSNSNSQHKNKNKENQEESLATLRALPDTGALVDCIEENFAKKHNLVIQPDTTSMIELVSAEGKTMRVIGTTKLKLMAPRGAWTTTVALVCPKLSHQFLMLWET